MVVCIRVSKDQVQIDYSGTNKNNKVVIENLVYIEVFEPNIVLEVVIYVEVVNQNLAVDIGREIKNFYYVKSELNVQVNI